MQIEKLPAGREMDKAIGQTLEIEPRISWEVLNENETASAFSASSKREAEEFLTDKLRRFPNSWLKDYHVGPWKHCGHYSTDLAAAWEVVKELKKQRWSFRYSNNAYADTQHAAAFYRRGIGRDILGGDYVYNDNAWAIANTECLAICRAALKAMGVSEI